VNSLKKLVTALCVVLLTYLVLVGCTQTQSKVEDTSKVIIDYLESKDYKIVSYEGKVLERTISEDDLSYTPYKNMWTLQEVNPADYIGEKLETYEVIVKNHILDNAEDNKNKQTIVSVLVVDGEIIGGTSKPDYDGAEKLGGFYSLEGKTLEEI